MNMTTRHLTFPGTLAFLLASGLAALATAYPSPATVNLGTAGYFGVLAETAITTTTGTTVTGDMGISPAAASYITGFGLIQPPTTYTTSAMVTGKVYAADFDPPTPTNMGIAIGDMYTAYTSAAGRAPDATELMAGDISGLNLAPGVYKWSTGVLINTSMTLTGTATDVWIFEIAGNLTVASAGSLGSGTHVHLAGGAQASNIFWQVGGVSGASIGTNATFNGNILAAKQIVIQTGAVFNGRALSQTQVTMDNNAVSAPVSAVVLKGSLAAASATSTGQSVLLTLTVTNTGLSNAVNVTASIWSNGGPGFDGPTPSTLASLTPGSAVTFTWTTTLAGAYVFHYSATASETSQPVASLQALATVTLPKAAVTARLAAGSATIAGGSFLLTLTASNSGTAAAMVQLTTTAFQATGVALSVTTYVGPTPSQPYRLDPGATVAMTWTVTAGSVGAGHGISNTLFVADANGGPALPSLVVTTAAASAVVTPPTTAVPVTGASETFIYPSPVHGAARIAYTMKEAGTVRIRVYNAAGQLVGTVEDTKSAGAQATAFSTPTLAPGVYFYLLERRYTSGTSDNIGPRKFVVTR